ncbi:MAG: hypothetical protein R3C18_23395 [Planctomycetaceae bacterium]
MAGMEWSELSAEERLVAEQAVMNLRLLNKACREAKSGTVLAVAEALAVQQGRELTRRTLETSLNAEGREVQKKGRPAERAAE